MSHFYGRLQGQAGEATRRGSKNSGLKVAAASWNGAVYTYLWHDVETGQDRFRVEIGPWKGHGRSELLATGTIIEGCNGGRSCAMRPSLDAVSESEQAETIAYRVSFHVSHPAVSDGLEEVDMPEGKLVGYARVSSTGQDLAIQLEKLAAAGVEPDDIFKEKRTGTDRGRPQLQQCLAYVRKGDTLLVAKIDRLARSTSDLYSIISQLQAKGVEFKVIDDPSIDTTSRTGKLVMGILALIAEFENDIRKERQLDGIAKAKERGVRFGVEPKLTDEVKAQIQQLRQDGMTVPAIMKQTELSKASVYRALSAAVRESGF